MSEGSLPDPKLAPTIEIAPGTLPLRGRTPPMAPTVLQVGAHAPEPAAPPAPVYLPGYEILGELGRGGMGVVYKARQKGLGRVVALKMVLAGSHAGPCELARFRTEAETVARLDHPNIVQVYEVDEYEGRPFLSLEYCGHGTLERLLNGKPIPPGDAATLVETLAGAIQAAHDAGVIHRDLKPANVLLAGSASRSPGDTARRPTPDRNGPATQPAVTELVPKISDFGLAKKLDVPGGNTVSGTVMGTPSYMAPEQAAGKANEVGPAADIYALGAILYECLTGRPPFVGTSPLETVLQVLNQEPLPPRMLNRAIDPDLEKITLKCLEKDPASRYPSAEALADDLSRYRNGEEVSARSVNLLERLQRELAYSQHDAALRPWGAMLIALGVLITLSHLATSLLLVAGWSETTSFWVPRSALLAVALPMVLRSRSGGRLLPTNTVERLLWAVWVGYLAAFGALLWVLRVMGHGHLEMYGAASVLSGLAWFAMGGYVWGGCYLIGMAFMAAAPALALLSGSPWSPFAFGCLWGVVLTLIGLRYRRLGAPRLHEVGHSGA